MISGHPYYSPQDNFLGNITPGNFSFSNIHCSIQSMIDDLKMKRKTFQSCRFQVRFAEKSGALALVVGPESRVVAQIDKVRTQHQFPTGSRTSRLNQYQPKPFYGLIRLVRETCFIITSIPNPLIHEKSIHNFLSISVTAWTDTSCDP